MKWSLLLLPAGLLLLSACAWLADSEEEHPREVIREVKVTVLVTQPPQPTPEPIILVVSATPPEPVVLVVTATPPPATPTPELPSIGTSREDPVPFGTTLLLPDGFEVTVLDVNPDAWEIVQAANQFNKPPAEGKRMVLLRLALTNVRTPEEPATWNLMSVRLVGSFGRPWSTFEEESRCGVIPERLDMLELYHGAFAEGNLCFQIPSQETDLLLRYDYERFSNRFVYFALTP